MNERHHVGSIKERHIVFLSGCILETKMKISKTQLRRIIKEEQERARILGEGWNAEVLSPLIAFGEAWSGLGSAVQEQIIDIVNGYIENREDVLEEINPNALNLAVERLREPIGNLSSNSNSDAEELEEALGWALERIEGSD